MGEGTVITDSSEGITDAIFLDVAMGAKTPKRGSLCKREEFMSTYI